MSNKGEKNDLGENTMSENVVNGRAGLASRTLSGSFTRSRKNSRIATVKPVTKCLSSSEEDMNKAGKINTKEATSPRIARLLSKDMAAIDKDVIVAELEKCLSELENNENPYAPLTDEYKRMEEERDELAKELENAFGDLEGYMHHVREVESERKTIEAEKDELAKEVEYLKYCLTHRQEVEENSLKLGKEALEAQLKEVNGENERMKDQINELLEERQSLIGSLLNLHSNEVDDVIQTRSRSCSVVSTDSASSSSLLRSECMELRDRVQEAEEAEMKVTEELVKCKEYLEETLKENMGLEKKIENLKDDISKIEEENDSLNDEIDKANQEAAEELKTKDETCENLRQEITDLQKELEELRDQEKTSGRKNESKENQLVAKLKELEEENSHLEESLKATENECINYRENVVESDRKFVMYKDKTKNHMDEIVHVNEELKTKVSDLEEKVRNLEELQDELSKSREEKKIIEKQMADIGEKLLNERALSRKQKADLQIEIDQLNDDLKLEKEKGSVRTEKEANFHKMSEEIELSKNEKRKLEMELRSLKKIVEQNTEELVVGKDKLQKKESDLNQKQKEFTEVKKNVDYYKKELERSTSSNEALENDKGRIEAELKELRGKLSKGKDVFSKEKHAFKQTMENLQSEIEQRNRELDDTKEELSREKSAREKAESKRRAVAEELQDLKSVLQRDKGKLEEELKSSLAERKILSVKLENATASEEKLQESMFSIRELEQSLSDATKEKKDLENEILSRVDQEKLHHEAEKKKLKEEIGHLRLKLNAEENGEREVLRLKSKIEDLNIFIERAETKVRELENELKHAKKQTSNAEGVVTALRKEKGTMQLEIGSLRSEIAILKTDLDKVTRQLRNACADVEKAISEKKLLKDQLEYSKFELENEATIQRLNKESEETVMSEKINLQLSKHEELRKELQLEIKRLKEEQNLIESDLNLTKTHLEQAQDKELKFRHSIDGLSENIEWLRRDKSNLEKALEAARSENNELSGRLRKMSHPSVARGQDAKLNVIVEENEELKRTCNALHDDLAKAHSNNKSLLDRVRNTEETNANTMRSLKARKSELQLQIANVQHEKEDLEKEVKVLKQQLVGRESEVADKEAAQANENEVAKKFEAQIMQAKEDLSKNQSKTAQLEEENLGYKQKLHESEELISDLQKAVARANDVAMEKALEISRHKRIFEKKFEKVMKENFTLRKQLYFDGSNFVENDRNGHGRSFSDLGSPTKDKSDDLEQFENDQSRPLGSFSQRKKSAGEVHKIIIREIDREKGISLSRSGSAPVTQRESDLKPIKTKVTAGSVTAPVKYYSDTDSVGSKQDSSDGDNAPPSPQLQNALPPTYEETNSENLSKEQDRVAIPQPNKIHRPILLKEIKFPRLSPAQERRNLAMHAANRRSPVMRRPAMRSPATHSPILDVDKGKQTPGKERMEHWV